MSRVMTAQMKKARAVGAFSYGGLGFVRVFLVNLDVRRRDGVLPPSTVGVQRSRASAVYALPDHVVALSAGALAAIVDGVHEPVADVGPRGQSAGGDLRGEGGILPAHGSVDDL